MDKNPLLHLGLTLKQVQTLRRVLHEMAKDGPASTGYGICYNLSRTVGTAWAFSLADDVVARAAVTWPGVHKKRVYIGVDDHPRCDYPVKAGAAVAHLWEGEQLRLRVSLIEHIDGVLADLGRQLGCE